MRLRVVESRLFLSDCTTRIPFRFGISTLSFAPLCTAEILIETESGERARGYSADLLVPKWFEKNPAQSAQDDVQALVHSAQAAGTWLTASDRQPATVFDLWWELYADRVGSQPEDAPDLLVHGFGVALMERAMMDAACRAAGAGEASFFDAVRGDLFGFEPERADERLAQWRPADALPTEPRTSVHVRHTVGLLDALRKDEIAAADRINDGLPESLEEDIRRYGLTHFKIKLGGDREQDLKRLTGIAQVFERELSAPPKFTLDGNEQFEDLAHLADLLAAVRGDLRGARFLEGLLYIEQPLSRARSFDRNRTAAMPDIEKFAPVIIDESDASLDAFLQATQCGYRGVSVKNCKGVFRALINRGRCDLSEGRLFQSAEDLTNLPVIALQQDLATVAALGISHVERNGHHFFRGLDHLPPGEASDALTAHPDLYQRDGDSISLRIENGQLQLQSLRRIGYGCDAPRCLNERTPAKTWRWPQS